MHDSEMPLWGSQRLCTPFLERGYERIPCSLNLGDIAWRICHFCGKVYQFCDQHMARGVWNAFCVVLSPIFARRFLSRIKQRGPREIPPSCIIPQQRAESEKIPFLTDKSLFFWKWPPGTIFLTWSHSGHHERRPQLALNSRLSKSWLACAASYIAEIAKKVIKNKLSCRKS